MNKDLYVLLKKNLIDLKIEIDDIMFEIDQLHKYLLSFVLIDEDIYEQNNFESLEFFLEAVSSKISNNILPLIDSEISK